MSAGIDNPDQSKRPSRLPVIVLTGASGIIGRHFIEAFRDDAYIYAIARRSQHKVHVKQHPNVNWMRADIAVEENVRRITRAVVEAGGADFVIHLAGYYDFENKPHPEFERTNVNGTKLILKYCKQLGIRRFILASSITVSKFKTEKDILTEESPADATFPYAISKRKCEQMVKEYAAHFPCTVVRLSAVISDWCEYGPLYNFLNTWLSNSWKAHVLGGRGRSAIPYIHVRNLNSFFAAIIRKSDQLQRFQILIAGHHGYTSHLDLYKLAVKYNFGFLRKPLFTPLWLAAPGMVAMDLLGRLTGNRPFERLWMLKYLDTQMNIDPTHTHQLLDWQPIPRYHIMRRLIFMIENMKTNPYQWDAINLESMHRRNLGAPNLMIYDCILSCRDQLIEAATEEFYHKRHSKSLPTYQGLKKEEQYNRLSYLLNIISTAIRTGDRFHALEYARRLAVSRFSEKISAQEVKSAIDLFGQVITEFLRNKPQLGKMDQRINDEIRMTIMLICDEVEDSYERIMGEA